MKRCDSCENGFSNLIKLFVLIVGFIWGSSLHAETVTQEVAQLGLNANAEYVKGSEDQPAVLIVHGFLTTNEFHTVVAMSKALQENNITTLAPTLTLNISQRKKSVKCNSIHTHTLEKDLIEIADWVEWLKQQGHKKIILLGHSSGSLEALEYLAQYKDPSVVGTIYTSMFYLNGLEIGTKPSDVEAANGFKVMNSSNPRKYSFLFCKDNYFAIPDSFLSYLKFSRSYVLQTLKEQSVPSITIMGGADKRYQSVGQNWLQELEQTGTSMIMVDGANHFFSSEYEFDLQDNIVESVQRLAR